MFRLWNIIFALAYLHPLYDYTFTPKICNKTSNIQHILCCLEDEVIWLDGRKLEWKWKACECDNATCSGNANTAASVASVATTRECHFMHVQSSILHG